MALVESAATVAIESFQGVSSGSLRNLERFATLVGGVLSIRSLSRRMAYTVAADGETSHYDDELDRCPSEFKACHPLRAERPGRLRAGINHSSSCGG